MWKVAKGLSVCWRSEGSSSSLELRVVQHNCVSKGLHGSLRDLCWRLSLLWKPGDCVRGEVKTEALPQKHKGAFILSPLYHSGHKTLVWGFFCLRYISSATLRTILMQFIRAFLTQVDTISSLSWEITRYKP